MKILDTGFESSESDLLECDNIVSGLHGGDTFTNRFNDARAFVAEHDRERALRVFSGKCVRI